MDQQSWKSTYRSIKQQIQSFNAQETSKDFSFSKYNTTILKMLNFNKTTTMKNDILNILKNEEKLAFDLEKEKEGIFRSIGNFRRGIETFKEKVKNFEKNPEYLEKIRVISVNLEKQIGDFKSKEMREFEVMLSEEEQLSKQLDFFQDKLSIYEEKTSENIQNPTNLANKPKENDISDTDDRLENINLNEFNENDLSLLQKKT